ncbi:MAG: outer membrane beta-barrel protein, partial [Bacteroidetes bacterium]|nr:outer membrane beta-barrel protein [Bacteroidota bacterium]
GFLELDFVGSFALQADLLYSQKGDENEVGSGTDRTLFEVKLNYVEVPVMLKLQGPLLGNAEANFYAGPSFAFKVSEATEGQAPGTLIRGTFAKRTDIGAALGIEFVIGLGGPQFLLDLRFTPGFSTIRDDAVIQTERDSFEIPDPEATNSTFSVMAGISL